jgi:hypothetical protein
VEPPPWKWSVTYTTSLDCAVKQIYSGEVWLRRGAQRLVLMSSTREVVDARFLHEGEKMSLVAAVEFPCHTAKIRHSLDSNHLMMASMPQIRMIRSTANWWLYRSPADAVSLQSRGDRLEIQSNF